MQGQMITDLSLWWPPALAALGGLGVGIVVRRTLLPWAGRAAARSSWKYDDILVEALDGPIVVWFVLLGLRLAVKLLTLDAGLDATIGTIIVVLGILSVAWAGARFASRAMRAGAKAGALPAVSLLASATQIVFFTVGLLMALQMLGIAIMPIITALGVAGLAVGLALQDTLANFFAGIRILMVHSVRQGDYIRLESGQEGWVEDIHWSQTTIREGGNSLVIVPNSKLSSAITVNYSLPSTPQNFVVNATVPFGTDLDKVERIALEVALETLHQVPDAEPDFVPVLRFTEFKESGVGFFVVLRAKAFPDRFSLISDYIRRLHQRFIKEGIDMPVPQRIVHTRAAASGSS